MRRFFQLLFMMLCIVTKATAQDQIEMAVVIPVQQTYISENTSQVFRSRLLGAMAANGVASAEFSGIAVYPEVSFTNRQLVEGGMRNIHVAEMQINFICEHIVTGVVFNSMTITVNAEGVSLDKAIMNGISKISANDTRLNNFMRVSREKIISYYKQNGNSLIARAQNLANLRKYDEAIALLYTYPASMSGYSAVSTAMNSIYKKYQADCCSQLVQQARAAYSIGNYSETANLLGQVDMQSPCAGEAKALANQVKQSRDAEAARVLAVQERAMQTAASVEKQRIKAIRDVAIAYYKSRPKYYFVY